MASGNTQPTSRRKGSRVLQSTATSSWRLLWATSTCHGVTGTGDAPCNPRTLHWNTRGQYGVTQSFNAWQSPRNRISPARASTAPVSALTSNAAWSCFASTTYAANASSVQPEPLWSSHGQVTILATLFLSVLDKFDLKEGRFVFL